MKSLVFLSTLLFLSMYCFTWTEGLECYQCFYIDGMDRPGNLDELDAYYDKSCHSGKKPNKKFVETCSIDNALMAGANITQIDWVCGKVYFETKIGDKSPKVTMRSCFQSTELLAETCITKTVQDIINEPEVPEEVKDALNDVKDLLGDASITGCSCKDDKCNSSSTLRNSCGLLFLSFAFVVSKFAGLL